VTAGARAALNDVPASVRVRTAREAELAARLRVAFVSPRSRLDMDHIFRRAVPDMVRAVDRAVVLTDDLGVAARAEGHRAAPHDEQAAADAKEVAAGRANDLVPLCSRPERGTGQD